MVWCYGLMVYSESERRVCCVLNSFCLLQKYAMTDDDRRLTQVQLAISSYVKNTYALRSLRSLRANKIQTK